MDEHTDHSTREGLHTIKSNLYQIALNSLLYNISRFRGLAHRTPTSTIMRSRVTNRGSQDPLGTSLLESYAVSTLITFWTGSRIVCLRLTAWCLTMPSAQKDLRGKMETERIYDYEKLSDQSGHTRSPWDVAFRELCSEHTNRFLDSIDFARHGHTYWLYTT